MRRTGWTLVSLCALLLLHTIWYHPVGGTPALLAAALAILAAARPFDALLVVAGIGPLATILLILTRSGSADLRFSEVLILAFVAGSSAHRAVRPRVVAVSRRLFWSATVLIAAAAASAAVGVAGYVAQQPGTAALTLARDIIRGYLTAALPLTPATLLAECLIVLLISADICATRPERREAVLRMMVAGAAGAALINLLRIVLAAASHDHPWSLAVDYFWAVRVNVHYPDLNAAGSYFAMMAFLAAGFLRGGGALSVLALVLIAAGVWISGSRTALAGAMVVAAAWLGPVAVWKRKKAVLFVGLGLIVLLAGALWQFYPHEKNATASAAWQIRLELAKAALRMAADHPVFGVGLGRFYELSAEYANIPGYPGLRENAHNNFLQVLAEMGAPALVLFLIVIATSLRELLASRAPSRSTFFLLAGIGAFLVTCLGGHPLLVHGAAYPFWIALGMAAAHGSAPVGHERRWRLLGLALLLALAATLPFRMRAAVREANLEGASLGLSAWQPGTDGSRYRWAGAHATFFVRSAARWVEIPLRHGPQPAQNVHVRFFIDGREADTVLLPDDAQWHVVRLMLMRRREATYSRIDLQIEPQRASGASERLASDGNLLMIGKVLVHE